MIAKLRSMKLPLMVSLVLVGFFCGAWVQATNDLKRPTYINETNIKKLKNTKDVRLSTDLEVSRKSATVLDTANNPLRKGKFFKRIFKKKNR